MTKKEIGEFVKEQRKLKKLTQQEFADQLNIRRQALIEIENAQTNYGVEILLVVLEGLGHTIFPKSLMVPKFNMKGVKSDPTVKIKN